MYHAAHRPFLQAPDQALVDFEKTGRIQWVSELAEIPAKFGVNNVYGELDTTFANSAVTHPRYCAALLGTLIKRSEEHTSELQSQSNLVCRLLLEKKKNRQNTGSKAKL